MCHNRQLFLSYVYMCGGGYVHMRPCLQKEWSDPTEPDCKALHLSTRNKTWRFSPLQLPDQFKRNYSFLSCSLFFLPAPALFPLLKSSFLPSPFNKFFVCKCFACTYVHVTCAYLEPREVRRGHWISQIWYTVESHHEGARNGTAVLASALNL